MQNDITQTTQTDMQSIVKDYKVASECPDTASANGITRWYNSKFYHWLGYYKKEMIKKPIDAFSTWVVGKGFKCESSKQQVELDNITGWGEDSFLSIMWNMIVMKKVNGDSFAEVIRNDKGTLINLKTLDPMSIVTKVNEKGIIIGYEQISTIKGKKPQGFRPSGILHLVNDRIGSEIHGQSVIEACEWDILAMKEAMEDWKKISHRSTIRVLYVDENDKTRLANLKTDYAEGIDTKNLLILPCKKSEAGFEDLTLPPVEAFLAWIRNCESRIYKAVGFPKSLTGDAEGIPESGGKMAYFNHMPIYKREVTDLEADLWNQLAVKVKFEEQESLTDSMNDTENKSINQTQAAQPSDIKI